MPAVQELGMRVEKVSCVSGLYVATYRGMQAYGISHGEAIINLFAKLY